MLLFVLFSFPVTHHIHHSEMITGCNYRPDVHERSMSGVVENSEYASPRWNTRWRRKEIHPPRLAAPWFTAAYHQPIRPALFQHPFTTLKRTLRRGPFSAHNGSFVLWMSAPELVYFCPSFFFFLFQLRLAHCCMWVNVGAEVKATILVGRGKRRVARQHDCRLYGTAPMYRE